MDSGAVWIVLGLVALAVGVGFFFRSSPEQRLLREWFQNAPLPRAQAEEVLMRHLTALKQRFPGRSEAWYLRKVVSDLKRDRR